MNILAIDSASVSGSACVCTDGKIVALSYLNSGINHSQTLMCQIKDVLQYSNMDLNDIDKIAVTVGPGSFTGIKISAATVKGLAFKNNITCIQISTLEALANSAKLFEGMICCVMDARRNQFYNALFNCHEGVITRLTQDRQIKSEELIKELQGSVIAVGDGAQLLYNICQKNNIKINLCSQSNRFINAGEVALIAHNGGGEAVTPENLKPVYLRPSQAERERMGIYD